MLTKKAGPLYECQDIERRWMLPILLAASLLSDIAEAGLASCGRVVWMTAVAGQSLRHMELIEVAIQSAVTRAPSLLPVVRVEPHALNKPQMQRFSRFVVQHGGFVVPHTLTFKEDFSLGSQQHEVRGAFARLEIGLVLDGLVKGHIINPEDVDTSYMLYTDADVMFLQNIDSCTLKKPVVALIGPEMHKGMQYNSGVL